MHGRSLAAPALLMITAFAFVACGGSAPSISDPGEILTKAFEAMQKAKTVHLEAAVDGTVNLDLLGTGQTNGLALTGTSVGADIALDAGDVRLDLAVPAMLGMTAEVIVVDDVSYSRTSFTGEKYTKGDATDPALPVDATDPMQTLKDLQEWLARPEVDRRKLADASCGTKTCYQVEIDLTAEDLLALLPELGEIGDATAVLTVLVEKDSLRPASVDIAASSPELGDLTVVLDFSSWDAPFEIAAPPADQIE